MAAITIIRVADFTAAYSGHVILNRLNFEVYRGEVFVILGGWEGKGVLILPILFGQSVRGDLV